MNLTLPEFAFIEGSGHEKGGDPLYGRNVIMHIRSASIIEIFGRKDVALNPENACCGWMIPAMSSVCTAFVVLSAVS